jgi:peptide-methionine (S)-S-oxide reductase
MARQPGVTRTRVGYTGGSVAALPTYASVSSGDGHSEAVRVWFDPALTSYDDILEAFFRGHQPRWPVRTKGRSVIWYHDQAQHASAERALVQRGRPPVAIEPVREWFDAEEYQQQYLSKEAVARSGGVVFE